MGSEMCIRDSTNTHWYKGENLIQYLENLKFETEKEFQVFTLPVQWVNRLSHEFRGFVEWLLKAIFLKVII